MDAIFGKSTCDRCGYKHATHNTAKDGSNEFFLCERCGYQHNKSGDEEEEHFGIGSYSFVTNKGIAAGGVYGDNTFFDKIDELSKAVSGTKLFYTVKRDDKYYLVSHESKQEWEFGEDDIICLDGLKKAEPTSDNLKATYIKK
jgi:hypothetical protein